MAVFEGAFQNIVEYTAGPGGPYFTVELYVQSITELADLPTGTAGDCGDAGAWTANYVWAYRILLQGPYSSEYNIITDIIPLSPDCWEGSPASRAGYIEGGENIWTSAPVEVPSSVTVGGLYATGAGEVVQSTGPLGGGSAHCGYYTSIDSVPVFATAAPCNNDAFFGVPNQLYVPYGTGDYQPGGITRNLIDLLPNPVTLDGSQYTIIGIEFAAEHELDTSSPQFGSKYKFLLVAA